MKIGNVNLKVSPLSVGVVIFFAIFLIYSYFISGNPAILIYGMPMLIVIFVIPMILNFMSQKQYKSLTPMYEVESKEVRIAGINENMLNTAVRFVGVVEKVSMKIIERPQFIVSDRSGKIHVRMFTSPAEDIKLGDTVEVMGSVIRRYIVKGDPAINCVSIRKVKKQ